jgi:hypothetical protein
VPAGVAVAERAGDRVVVRGLDGDVGDPAAVGGGHGDAVGGVDVLRARRGGDLEVADDRGAGLGRDRGRVELGRDRGAGLAGGH